LADELEPKQGALDEDMMQVPPECPVIPLRDLVVFPYLVAPISVGRVGSVAALDAALDGDRKVVLLTQRDSSVESPTPEDLYQVGTISIILRMARLESEVRILAQGLARVRVKGFKQVEPFMSGNIEEIPERRDKTLIIEALMKTVIEQFKKTASLGKNISQEMLMAAEGIEEPGMLADMITTNLDLAVAEKQEILETADTEQRLRRVVSYLTKELEVLSVSSKIQDKAQQELGKAHREYVLREQLKAIKTELGETDERGQEIEEYKAKIEEAGMPEEVKDKALKEVSRLERMHPDSAESAVVRTYLDWMTNLPWSVATVDNLDIANARRILDADHYGLDKIKERLLEYLAVKKIRKDTRGAILCFVGPPGTGKTSLGKSMARALGKKFVRISLGGVHDEAEIRGHRRTYVGALPGRIIQGIRDAGSRNPLFMLDEIDKLGSDFRGDPSSAMLEVLDPEQNFSFTDHYLDVAFDLSDVMFVATGNLPHTIPPPLRDRMEIIYLSSYTLREKIEIASRHLVPKQLENHGMSKKIVKLPKSTIRFLAEGYTREAGVRNLERSIANILRKVAVKMAEGKKGPFRIDRKTAEEMLGHPDFLEKEPIKIERPGVATGLVWTEVGGDVLQVECTHMPGRGKLILTGQVGQVMQESAQAALSFVRSNTKTYGLPADFFDEKDLHVHLPAGATPKDGPSAGITMAAAIVSLFTGRLVRNDVAMTGEITLQGRVFPVGGLKEKILAAHRYGLKEVIIPYLNRNAVDDVPKDVRDKLQFHFVKNLREVINIALEPEKIKPVKKAGAKAKVKAPGKAEKKRSTTKRPPRQPTKAAARGAVKKPMKPATGSGRKPTKRK
jgi:ATP-dependent Lon protease